MTSVWINYFYDFFFLCCFVPLAFVLVFILIFFLSSSYSSSSIICFLFLLWILKSSSISLSKFSSPSSLIKFSFSFFCDKKTEFPILSEFSSFIDENLEDEMFRFLEFFSRIAFFFFIRSRFFLTRFWRKFCSLP
jgi:hypothetical protein